MVRALAEFSDDELLEEIVRRKNGDDEGAPASERKIAA